MQGNEIFQRKILEQAKEVSAVRAWFMIVLRITILAFLALLIRYGCNTLEYVASLGG